MNASLCPLAQPLHQASLISNANGDNFARTSRTGQFPVLYLRERLRGTLEDSIWAVHYQKRFWQAVINGGHSIPLTVLGAVLAWLGNCDALLAFSRARVFASARFHALGDLPVHAIDAHRQFLPLSQHRFQSSLSYWDPRFHAKYVALVEALAVMKLIRV